MALPGTDSMFAFLGLILGFGFVIFVHELGHFVVAKAVGIKCTQFAIGFGQALITWRKGIGFRNGSTEPEYEQRLAEGANPGTMGETEYRLNWMPLGGYVKMLGQDDANPAHRSDDPRSFSTQPIWARACVISAGVIMNLIFGIVFLTVAFRFGVALPPATVGAVHPQMPAASVYADGHEDEKAYLGLRPGDHIRRINGAEIDDFSEIWVKSALASKGTPLRIEVDRPGEDELLHFTIVPALDDDTQLLALGIMQPVSNELAGVPALFDGKGIKAGMRVTEAAGVPIDRYDQLEAVVAEARGEPVPVKVSGHDTEVVVAVAAQPGLVAYDDRVPLLGLVPPTRVRAVLPSLPAARAGIEPGDIVVKAGSASWPTTPQLIEAIEGAMRQPIRITVLRDGELLDPIAVTPDKNDKIGVSIEPATETRLVGQVVPGSPAEALNLTGGSKVLSVRGEPVRSYRDIQKKLEAVMEANPDGGSVEVGFALNIKDTPPETREVSYGAADARAVLDTPWICPISAASFQLLRERVAGESLPEAAALGIEKTHQFMLQTYITILRLVQRSVKLSHMRGPVGIVDEGTRVAKQGWQYLLFFLGVISVNLAVINFLPIPIVDGGLMVFLLIEKLKGSPVGPRVYTAANLLGLAMIASLFLVITFFDLSRLLGG